MSVVAWHGWTKDRAFLPFLGMMLGWEAIDTFLVEPRFPQLADIERLPTGTPALLISLLTTVALAPVAEEIFFRGYIYSNLRARAGFATTITITSLLFAFPHFSGSILVPILTLPFALIAGLARERFGSVRPAVYLHAVWNLLAWGSSYFAGTS